MELYALVGSSGTGKSYQALKLCKKLHIDYLIDDGILIHGQKKIAGNSAKRETSKVGAVKRAIFFWDQPRQEMQEALAKEQPDKLLIIGTSIKMVQQIADHLQIEPIDELVFIEDISSQEDIEAARYHRMEFGQHVIPLPTLEVKKDFSGYFLDTLKIFTRVFGKREEIEKSVVRPTFSFLGKYTISSRTLHQIVEISLSHLTGIYSNEKIRVIKSNDKLKLELEFVYHYGVKVHELSRKILQKVKEDLENMTQLHVVDIQLSVKSLKIK